MHEQLPFLLAIAIMTLAAVSMGLAMVAFKQPPLVGYILAGVALGPAVFGFVPRAEAVPLLAEFGVLFLLFLVGMEISLKAFLADLRPAVLTVLGQLAVSLAAIGSFGYFIGWKIEQIVLLAFIVTMSSTAVALKILDDVGELRTELGRLVVAIMIAQDIAIVPMLIITESLGDGKAFEPETLVSLAVAIGGMALFIGFLGPRGKLQFPWQKHILGRVELVTLVSLFICCAAATLTGVFGLSSAYGAFLAGLLIGKTTLRSEAIAAMEPIQGVLMALFFVAIGLLLDVGFILKNAPLVAVFVLGALLLKSIANILILRAVGQSWTFSYQAGLMTGQIGEFAFVLAAVGLANEVLDPVGYKLAISIIVLSLLFSPLWLVAVRRTHAATESGLENLRAAIRYAHEGEPERLSRRHVYLRQVYRLLPSNLRFADMPAKRSNRQQAAAAPDHAAAPTDHKTTEPDPAEPHKG